MTDATAPRGIHAIAAATPDAPAIHFGSAAEPQQWTWAQLDQRANGVAHVLHDAGVRPGDRVAVRLHNRPEVFAVWNGIARVGALVVPISYRAAPAEIAYLTSDSGATVLVTDEPLKDAAVPDGTTVLDVAAGDLDRSEAAPPIADRVASVVSWMNYTSGTTGRPKGIVRPAPAPATQAPPSPFAQFWGFGPGKPHLLCGPAYHTAPGAYAQMSLVEGGPVVVMTPFDAAECLALIQRHRVTSTHMVPANFVRILELDDEVRAGFDLGSIDRVLHGAAPCPEAVKRAIMDVFPPDTVWEYYGASEGMGSVISPQEWLAHPGSVGRPFPGLEVVVLDDDGQPLPPGEVGTLYLSAMPGFEPEYHNAPDKTEQAYTDGRFTVGDLGWVDDDGYIHIADRRDDLILRGGVNVYPAEVEAALALHPNTVDAAVLGIPDDRLGQAVHAVVECNTDVTGDELRAFLADHLADFKIPTSWSFVDQLPREPNGKVRKADLLPTTATSH